MEDRYLLVCVLCLWEGRAEDDEQRTCPACGAVDALVGVDPEIILVEEEQS
jgi:hypothetical protein